MLLQLKNVTVKYEAATAIKEISITVNSKEIVTIVGSNGAGKSTVLKTIVRLVNLTSGEIWFDGKRIDSYKPEEMVKRGIAICMERRRLFPQMTVLENLEMGAFHRKDKKAIKRDLSEIFDQFPILLERRKQKAGTLSGGEQQMVTIGRALMSKPRLLLLDEPSIGLAPKIVSELARNLRQLHKLGMTILLVEQNAKLAFGISDRGYVLETGKLTIEGPCQALCKDNYIREAYLGI